ncbi:cupin domain-containing protein [Pseudonocardia sp. KRD291]|uniref:cupin domain-containing protein n=1 Tax=Pseudonocardia sp. KRD291 TaxID=2792007 RepID=UPI001C4A601E|nr:cupin domain-containing protein [Pseudonocardia sp. KRD291]MBW0102113.1 cupin domain-containing protein [Pseudonocardia sp. KRD291]
MTVVRHADQRRTETPNAVMTTLVSPTLGGARHAMWQVRMDPGAAGPEHRMTGEQVWTVVDGVATVELDGDDPVVLGPGDTAVLLAGRLRRIVADEHVGMSALVTGPGDARAELADGTDRGTPDWIA